MVLPLSMLQNTIELYGRCLGISVVVIKADSTDVSFLSLSVLPALDTFYGFDKIGYAV